MTFSIGEMVTWKSQAQGYSKSKTGEVVGYVPPGDRPDRERFPDLHRGIGCGFGRSTESWVVRVGDRHYWPISKNLKRVHVVAPTEDEINPAVTKAMAEMKASILRLDGASRHGCLQAFKSLTAAINGESP